MFKPTAAASLFEVFHENTKYTRAHYAAHAQRINAHLHSRSAVQAMSRNFKVYRFAPKIPLPEAEPVHMPLHAALHRRVSSRSFAQNALSLETLASVLVPAAACNRVASVVEFPSIELQLRSYPSGGGEFPVEIYPVLLNVAGVESSITHFDPRAKALSIINRMHPVESLSECLMHGDGILQSAAALVVLTAVFERSTQKYRDRGYRLVLLEAGHLAQNLCLTAAAAGLGSCAWGGFFDDELNDLLGVDGVNEAAVHCVFIGGAAQ